MSGHRCDFSKAWPIGHPLPPEDPAKLQGPEVGTVVRYRDPQFPRWDNMLMRIKARSYVWSPGECNHNGGNRLYNMKVVEWPALNRRGEVFMDTMVVDDIKLEVVK